MWLRSKRENITQQLAGQGNDGGTKAFSFGNQSIRWGKLTGWKKGAKGVQ